MSDNPILNSPYHEPRWHYATDLNGHLNYEDIRPGRRIFDPTLGGYTIPVKRQTQGSLLEVNEMAAEYGTHLINLVRQEVGKWRKAEYPDTTGATRELLRFWFLNPERHPVRMMFFAQREAVETAIWLNEVAAKSNAGTHILNKLRDAQATESAAEPLPRICFKMATGTGKTVVMAALILYHYVNRQEYRQDTRFCDYFLLVAPGITIKDRLGVLFVDNNPNKHEARDYYRERDLVPPRFERILDGLNARLVITNYHAFEPKTLQGNKRSVFDGKRTADGKKQEGKEDMALVLRRVLGKFKKGGRILLLNDEAHHCYLPLPKSKTNDDQPAEDNVKEENERAAVWYSGLREIARRYEVRAVYDLSATPYYLSGSGHQPYGLFPWIVSEFGLTDAIESGLVKIPFLPELDNTQELTPVLRDLYTHVKDDLPRKGAVRQRAEAKKEGRTLAEEPPKMPLIVQTALDQFYNHYKQYETGMRAAGERSADLLTAPPVFIAVCNNTNVSKELYKHIAGYEIPNDDGSSTVVPGKCELFNNYQEYGGQWRPKTKPPTLLIDSDALENSNQVNDDFKKVFAPEIAAFKRDYRQRHPDKSVENLTDADLLREVVNTVGKNGALGGHVRAVVSVSMLTEGWDCLDSQTQILTPDGWKGMEQVKVGDSVFAWNPASGKTETTNVEVYGQRNLRQGERMVCVKGQHFDVRVTEGHNIYFKYRNPRKGGMLSETVLIKKAGELPERKSSFSLPVATETNFEFPGIPLSDDEIRFIAWFMTDGGFSNYKVSISQSKIYFEEIRALLDRLKLDYTEKIYHYTSGYNSDKPLHIFNIPKGNRTDSRKRNGWITYEPYLNKNVSPLLHQMTRRQFKVFWDEMLKGDGEKSRNKAGWLWCDRIEQADAYTQMAILRGFSASYSIRLTKSGKTVYRISIRDKQWITTQPSDSRSSRIFFEDPAPAEKVWCVSNPIGTLITRRNGKIVVLGNCNTVSHIMGLRAFGSQLLCEQVAGRALRRKQYVPLLYHETVHNGKPAWKPVAHKDAHKYNPDSLVLKFPPEYAHIIGVPFKMFKGGKSVPPEPLDYTTVKALPERQQDYEIVFPQLIGYKYEMSGETITADFDGLPNYEVDLARVPVRTVMSSVFLGVNEAMEAEDVKDLREQEIVYGITRHLINLYFNDSDGGKQFHLFGQLKDLVAAWYRTKVVVTGAHPGEVEQWKKLVVIDEPRKYCGHIYEGIQNGRRNTGAMRVLPVFNHYNRFSSTKYIHGQTTKPCWETVKSHVNYVVADAASTNPEANFWEHVAAKALDAMPEVEAYVKNAFCDFQIPYVADGKDRIYKPDFLIRLRRPDGSRLMLILEITGANKQYKAEKKYYAETYWVPAVNAVRDRYPELQGMEWRFLEVEGDLRDLKRQIMNFLI